MANPQVIVEYVAKVDKLAKASQEVGFASTKAGQAARKAFVPAGIALAAITAGALKATDAASALNEQIAASRQVFGKQAGAMDAWAKTGATAFGLSRREALAAANAYGNVFATIGFGTRDAAKLSRTMVQLAGDMASFHDADPSEMLDKLRSGLAGEAEPLRKYGVLLSEARVKQKAYALGIAKTGDTLTEQQKVQARYALIMDDTAKAQGDFARTSDSVANKQRTVAAETENASAAFGKALLPVMQIILGAVSKVIGWLARYPGVLQAVVAAIATLTIAIIALNVAMTVMAIVTGPISVWFIVAAAAIAALVAIVIVLWRNWDSLVSALERGWKAIKDAAAAVWNWLKANWPLLVGVLTGPFGLAAALIVRYWDQIKSAVTTAANAVRSALGTLAGWIAGAARQITAPLGWIDDALGAIAHAAVSAVGIVKAQLGSLAGWISGIVGGVAAAAGRVADAIKRPINAMIGAWNALGIPRVAISLPKIKVAGKTLFGGGSFGFGPYSFPDIPMLAGGGVVSAPTLAVVGEGAGREIVSPEALLRQIVAEHTPEVRVFIGDQELRGIVRYEVRTANQRTAQVLLAGGGPG